MFLSFWKNKIVSFLQWVVFTLGSILFLISLLIPFYHTRFIGLVLIGSGIIILILRELSKTKEERNWFRIIRILLLIVYGCALPFTILFALMWPLAVDSIPNNGLFLFAFFLFLIPISIFITLIKCLFEKRKSIIWLLLPLIAVALLFMDDAISHYFIQKNYQANQPIPFSERGLPVPVTDVPAILPPDPGEAGKTTLAGIDSNNDGVRDDLEREIVYMYPKNEEVRRVLRAEMKITQQIIITENNDHKYLAELFTKQYQLMNCYTDLVLSPGMEISAFIEKGSYWTGLALNTKQRLNKYNNIYDIATPFNSVIVQCKDIQGQY